MSCEDTCYNNVILYIFFSHVRCQLSTNIDAHHHLTPNEDIDNHHHQTPTNDQCWIITHMSLLVHPIFVSVKIIATLIALFQPKIDIIHQQSHNISKN